MSDVISRSWFVVFCNPEEHGYLGTPEEIIEKLKNEWIENHPLRKGWWLMQFQLKDSDMSIWYLRTHARVGFQS